MPLMWAMQSTVYPPTIWPFHGSTGVSNYSTGTNEQGKSTLKSGGRPRSGWLLRRKHINADCIKLQEATSAQA